MMGTSTKIAAYAACILAMGTLSAKATHCEKKQFEHAGAFASLGMQRLGADDAEACALSKQILAASEEWAKYVDEHHCLHGSKEFMLRWHKKNAASLKDDQDQVEKYCK